MKEHARRNSFDVEAESINAGLNIQITNTPGNTDADNTSAVNIVSCKLARFRAVMSSDMILNSSTNVKCPPTGEAEKEVEK
jgi:hypothetical protein